MSYWKQEILKRLAGLNLAPAREAEIVEELSQHLEDRFGELVARGAAEAEARRMALKELSDEDIGCSAGLRPATSPLIERSYRTGLARGLRRVEHEMNQEPTVPGGSGRGNFLASLWQDLRYGLRMLRKNPGFTAVAVMTLALGVGANTTVFTVINTLVLNPIPVKKPSELAGIYSAPAKPRRYASLLQLSYPNLQDLQERNNVFSSLAGFSWPMYVTISKGAASERMFAEFVTGNYFDTLGIHPARGRFFLPEEARAPGESPVAVLSYGAWKSRFDGDSGVVGRTILLNRIAFTVVGVAPQGFLGVSAVFGPDVWVPATMSAQLFPNQRHDWLHDRGESVFIGAARLKDGVNIQQAQANLKDVAANLEKEYPETNRGRSVELQPLNDVALSLQPTPREGGGQPLILTAAILMAIVGIVLLIACSNVANLLMARAASRRQEMAVRLALGAGRHRLSRQLLTENVLLSLFGGVTGLVLASAGTKFLWSFRPPEFAQNLADLKFSGPVFVFTLVISLATALVFGMVPALRSSRVAVVEVLKDDSRTAAGPGRSRKRFANALLAGQVALSLMSLIAAALFIRSIEQAYRLDPGFDTAHTAMFFVSPGQAGYDHTRTEELYREVRGRVAALPGIRSVSWSSNLPLWAKVANDVLIEGRQSGHQSEAVSAVVNTVDLDYFSTVRIPLLRGRDFTAEDKTGSLPAAIVNETMAEKYWPGQDPIGKRFRFTGEDTFRQIVGVARTANYSSLGESPQSCIYLPLRQNFSDTMVLYVNTAQDPAKIFSAVQYEVRQLDPQLPLYDFRTGHKIIDQALFSAKMGVGLLGVFGLLALGLASVGLYGVMAYSVNQRRHEIGVRMALGASSGSILRQVLRQGAAVVGIGIGIGLVASLLVDRGLAALLYGVSPTDPASVAGACLALASVAFVACYLPARRASRVDPMVSLRYE